MGLQMGMHSGPQDLSMEELLRLWRRVDEAGFAWASVWDHFYANPLVSREDPCFEGVAAMAGLASHTRNVRVGCLVFCGLFRTPGMLAKAAVTIDHLSGGRAEVGIGAGWFQEEFEDFGYDFPPLGRRLDQLEEVLQIVRSLLHDPVTDFEGRYYELHGAHCFPKPVRGKLPIWVGGRGPRRTPRLAARYADGYNLPYVSPEEARSRMEALETECERIDRDAAQIERSVNLGFYMSPTDDSPAKTVPQHVAGGSLVGGPQQVIDRIGEYVDAGVEGLNIALRPPIDWEALEAYIEHVMPAFSEA